MDLCKTIRFKWLVKELHLTLCQRLRCWLTRWKTRLDSCLKENEGERREPLIFESCLWRNWKIDNLGVSDVTGSETGPQFSYLFGSKIASSAPSHPNDFRNSFFGTFPYIVKNILRYISVHGDMYLIFFDLRIFWILVASSMGPNWLIPGSRPN